MRRIICAALLHATAALVAPTTSLPRRAHRRHTQHRQPTQLPALPLAAAVRSAAELRFDAYEWCANYAAPASLVAGAVIASLYDVENDPSMAPRVADRRRVRVAKKGVRLMLISAFTLEILAVFITTITGTMLLSDGSAAAAATPMAMLKVTFELEYLACRVCFLQGLVNWLGAIALQHAIPKAGETTSTRRINNFVSSSLCTLIILMAAIYNDHTEYQNYLQMLRRLAFLVAARFYAHWPPRIMPALTVPALLLTTYLGFRALTSPQDDDNGAPA